MAEYSGDANRNFMNLGRIVKPAGHVDVSAGTEMPDGILGAPMAKGSTTMTARQLINSTAEKVTAPVRAKLAEMGASTVTVRNMITRKR